MGIKNNFSELVLFFGFFNQSRNEPPKKDQKALFVYNINFPGVGGKAPARGLGRVTGISVTVVISNLSRHVQQMKGAIFYPSARI